jgi:L-ascorbate metabolism protein UlaG (beta-lactamase superfamily)
MPAEPVLTALPFREPLAERLKARASDSGATLFWLGQAGFLIEAAGRRIVVDPYLSDSLAEKYRGSATPHERMMAAPIGVPELAPVDLVLVTHHHTDHMDAATLRPLAAHSPDARIVVPAASLEKARAALGGSAPIVAVDARDVLEPLPGVRVTAIRAAHETLERDEAGRHRFLGYGIEAGGVRIVHSGDTIPFDGQDEEVAGLRAHLALLPVNGRSTALRERGIAGNLTLEEAVALARRCGIPALIAHHYGMFAFNTADPEAIDRASAAETALRLERARLGIAFRLAA